MAKNILTVIIREFDDFAIPQREDGFLDATAIAKTGNIDLRNWWRQLTVFRYLYALAKKEMIAIHADAEDLKSALQANVLNSHIGKNGSSVKLSASLAQKWFPGLVEIKKGGNSTAQTWVHPKVGIRLAQSVSEELAVEVDSWVQEILTTGATSTTDFNSNLGVALGKRLRVTKKPCPWDLMYQPDLCRKVQKWYGFDCNKFYWWYAYNFLNSQERADIDTYNPLIKHTSKSGATRTMRRARIHQHLSPETRERLHDFAEYLALCIKFSSSRVEFEKKWALEYGLPTQLEIFDLWEFAS